ncbi:sensor histidine kinase [Jiangella alkaliphila]|uniref:histidine kinase n=1 Tax=Jiangella alkaliphila TaxID=419479 RepID=A0A1H2L471_9ACTN|nr:histidine kinase [Jiangella alkaliphila]SDU75338.1 Histidine kinase [Jiangella alkaliphila]
MSKAAVAVLALLVTGLLGYGWSLGFHLDNAHNGLIGASFTAVGLYVLRMRPRHREGRLFLAVGLLHVVMFFGRQYGLHDDPLPGAAWVGWIGVWPLPLAIAVSGWALMAFPDGRLLSPRWRVPLGVMMAVATAMSVVSALWPVEYERTGLAGHPLDLPGADAATAAWPYVRFAYLLFQVLWTVALVVRVRRARGDERRQLYWLGYAVVLDLALLVAGLALLGSPVPGLLGVPLVPLAAGVAILKYRLYDIDPLLGKTIVIGAMLAVVTGGYVAVVVGVGALVPAPDGLLSVVATALVAVAFEPLRRRAQRLADRIVYGHRVTPYEALSTLSTQLSAAPDELLDGVAATVGGAVGAREVVVWVGDEARLVPAAAWPAPVGSEPSSLDGLGGPGVHVRPVRHDGLLRGAITLRKPPGEPLLAGEEQLLGDLAAQTGMVIVHEAQRAELQSTARRIVTAQDEARQRIERDLHDGAQQRLVTLGLELGVLAAHAKASGDGELAGGVQAARTQLLEATSELRELARGLHPSVLTQAGLPDALRTLADRSAVPVRLDADLAARPPAEVEATAYFLVSEALTNAARHAGATLVTVTLARDEQGLRVEVADDGAGGARLGDGDGDGSGLQGLADRLAALGARLDVDSPPGGGTRLRTVIPCA